MSVCRAYCSSERESREYCFYSSKTMTERKRALFSIIESYASWILSSGYLSLRGQDCHTGASRSAHCAKTKPGKGGDFFVTHVSMRVSTPVVMANLIVSSDAAASPAGHPRTCNLLPIMGMMGTSTLSPTPLRRGDVQSQNRSDFGGNPGRVKKKKRKLTE